MPACDLYRNATQAVFGEGSAGADLMLVGERPGDKEDLAGAPFVGPAGRVLDDGLAEAGIERTRARPNFLSPLTHRSAEVRARARSNFLSPLTHRSAEVRARAFVTNAVKHFKWKPSPRPHSKQRIHAKPNAAEIAACRPWLEQELEVVQPKIVVCLGATAAQALLGRTFRVTQQHGQWVEWSYEPRATATVHPSSILRPPDADARANAFAGFVSDLKIVAGALNGD